jgi:hypothetical protein
VDACDTCYWLIGREEAVDACDACHWLIGREEGVDACDACHWSHAWPGFNHPATAWNPIASSNAEENLEKSPKTTELCPIGRTSLLNHLYASIFEINSNWDNWSKQESSR